MQWFEENLSRLGRRIDETIEAIQSRLQQRSAGPTMGSRVREVRERATESVRHATERVGEEVDHLVRSMKSEGGAVPRHVWPLMILAIAASAGLTYMFTGGGTSIPAPTATELREQEELRRDAARRRSAFDSFVSQDRRAIKPAPPAPGGK